MYFKTFFVYIVLRVLFLYFYYSLYITHLLLMFIPCGNGRFGDTAITASLKPMSAYPRVFENISKAVQSPTKERLFSTPEIYLQNKANCQSQVSSSFLHLHPKAKGVQCVFFISQTPMVQFRCGATSAQIIVVFMAAIIKIMPPSYMSHCIARKYLYACSELIT